MNMDMTKHGSGPSGDAAAGAGAARSRSSKDGTARVLEGGRQGGHSTDCIGLPRRASVWYIASVQMSEGFGAAVDGNKDWSVGTNRHSEVRWQRTSSFF